MIDKETKKELISQIDIITNWNFKLADFYKEPNRITDIREIIFREINELRKIIFKNSK